MTVALAGFCLLALALHFLSIALAARRVRLRRRPLPAPADAALVTVIRPVCGIEAFSRETLGSSFALDYPNYELLFCVARADDPVTAIVYRLIDAHPEIPARLLVGDDRVSLNPKLNNTVKGWDAAGNDWIIMADSNVLMPRDYIQRLLARWRHNSGVVCSVPIASRPTNFWAELECAFLNTYEARWEYAADLLGFAFAQGKSMLMRKSVIDRGGGIRAFGAEIAEDAALTKLLRAADLKVHLVDNPFEQPLGARSAAEVWSRQTRWSRLRRMTFPLMFVPELLPGAFFPFIAAMTVAAQAEIGAVATALSRRGVSRAVARRRSGARARSRLALVDPHGARLRSARHAAAAALGRCLARQQLHLARHRNAAARSGRSAAIKKRPPELPAASSRKLRSPALSAPARSSGFVPAGIGRRARRTIAARAAAAAPPLLLLKPGLLLELVRWGRRSRRCCSHYRCRSSRRSADRSASADRAARSASALSVSGTARSRAWSAVPSCRRPGLYRGLGPAGLLGPGGHCPTSRFRAALLFMLDPPPILLDRPAACAACHRPAICAGAVHVLVSLLDPAEPRVLGTLPLPAPLPLGLE